MNLTFHSSPVPARPDKPREVAARVMLTERGTKQEMSLSAKLGAIFSLARATVMAAMNVRPTERG